MLGLHEDIARSLRHPLVRIGIAIALLALVVVIALGGFREAKSRQQSLPRTGVGQVAASDAFEVEPLCAYTSDRMPGRRYPEAGKRYLVLQARVVNRMEMDWSDQLRQDVVWPADGRGQAAPAQWLLRADDHSLDLQLPPRIPAVVELVWPLAPGATASGPWGLYQRTRMPRSLDTGEDAWLQQTPHALLVVPIGAACAETTA